MIYKIQAYHASEKLRLKEIRNRFSSINPVEFSNTEMILKYSENSYTCIYNFGSIVFFNVPDEIQKRELSMIPEIKTQGPTAAYSDFFSIEVSEAASESVVSKVFFDRVVVPVLNFRVIKIVCMLLAESTALESYENLIENLLLQTNQFSKRLENTGKTIQAGPEFIRFIGTCLNIKQEIIANLYIVDSPDETWEDPMLDRLHTELKAMLEVDVRYRALEYKIKIIQESLDVIVDLSKSRRETILELVIILLIAFEATLSVIKWNS